MSRLRNLLLMAPALALVCLLVLGPAALLIRVSLYQPATGRGFYTPGTVTLVNYFAMLDSTGLRIATYTAGFGLVVGTLVVCIGYPLALFLRSLTPIFQALGLSLILIPKTAGLLATFFGLQRILPRGGVAAVIGEVYMILPYAVLVLFIQLITIRPSLIAAANGLGATPWQAFRRVTLPMSLPGLIVAFQLGLMWGVGAFLGPVFLGGPNETTLSVELHRQAFEYGHWPRAAAEAVCLIGMVGIAAMWHGFVSLNPKKG
jgi:ABC-type spermidine/putrescine transport system permease subunit I